MAEQRTIDPTRPRPPEQEPPVAHGDDGGGGGGWALLCSVADRYEAEMIRGVLEGDGLGPVVIETVQVPGSWLLPSGHERLPQRVFVLRALLDAARLALLEAGYAGSEDATIPTPGPSPEERWRRATRFVRWAVLVAVGGVFASYLIHLLGGSTRG